MRIRVCRQCGNEYRGLACPHCHPRGSRKRRLESERALEDRRPVQSAGVPEASDTGGLLRRPPTSDACPASRADETECSATGL